ncbi:testis-expressed protein 22 [Pteronotus mesoamericanus]|uniref:testis-expressed protein 22 n=1 Tax=Pteronotus mesoamericanus TaxID=1884717 RepID=UPI0023ECA171|nr:testis-expressed protein 22 [Pteronotus parnellii mesoamericanus]
MNSRTHLLKDPPGGKAGPQPSHEDRPASPSPSPAEAWGQPRSQSSGQQALETQDWVCEPPGSRRPGRHWSLSIDERRQRAARGAAGASAHCPDLLQVVAQLVSEDVDRDVLIPHRLRPAEAARAPSWLALVAVALILRSPFGVGLTEPPPPSSCSQQHIPCGAAPGALLSCCA